MRTILLTLMFTASLVAVAAPAAASDYNVCDPAQAVCVVQDDANPGDPECELGYLEWYGAHRAENAVIVTTPVAQASARAFEYCGHWFIGDTYSYGFRAGAETDQATLSAYWVESEHTPNPNCYWNPERHEDTTRLGVHADSAVGRTGAQWHDDTATPCGETDGESTCETRVYATDYFADAQLGCPVGDPVPPPSPSVFPYGRLIP